MTRVKVCGITNIEDAQCAADCGANALGFIFAQSGRHVDVATVQDIVQTIPPFVSKVGVFVNEDAEEVVRIFRAASLDYVQLHGEESADYLRKLRSLEGRIIKAIRVRDEASVACLSEYQEAAAFLLDTYVEEVPGGTGRTFDWDLVHLAKEHGKPVIIAGGLSPENVERALALRPHAVDGNSGLETSPGRKDPVKVREFIRRVRQYDV